MVSKYKDLLEVIDDEVSMVDEDWSASDLRMISYMESARRKIGAGITKLTSQEVKGVQFALEDQGNELRHGEDSTPSDRKIGERAWIQAEGVGATFAAIDPDGGGRYVTVDPMDPNIIQGALL